MRLSTRMPGATLLSLAFCTAGVAQPSSWFQLDGPDAAGLHSAAIASDGTLLAGTYVTVLRNAGTGWSPVASAVNGSIHDIGTAPGGRVWAGTSGALRSDDAGATWQWFSIRTAPHSGTHPSVLHVAQSPAGTVFAGAYRSANGGTTWDPLSIYAYATAFVGSTVYAGTQNGVHRSTTAGLSWESAGLQGTGVRHMAAVSTRLLAAASDGILVSDDGASWTPVFALQQVSGLAVAGDGSVWASAPDGLYRSQDGVNWPTEPLAFAGLPVHDVAARDNELFALAEGNPHVSTDLGTTWEMVNAGLGMPRGVAVVAAGGMIAVGSAEGGPFRSSDNGNSWLRWTDGLPGQGISGLVVDAGAGRAVAQVGFGLYRAALDGSAWSAIPLPGDAHAHGVATDGAVLLALASTSSMASELYTSTDGGTTWTMTHSDADAFDASVAGAGGVLVAAFVGVLQAPRLLVSVDGGVTWESHAHPTSPQFGPLPALFVDGAGRIYVADGGTLRRSADFGQTWTVLGAAGASGARVEALHADADALCIGSTDGVWCSVDDGLSFAPASAGLPGGASVVALTRDGERYVAMTAENGVFASDAATAGAPTPAGVGQLRVDVSPRPAEGAATVTLSVAAAGDVHVDVFDVTGRRVATLQAGPLPPGAHALALDAGSLAPGVYVVRAAAAAGVAATRLVVR